MRTLQEVRYWAAQSQAVFICGLERSGTSMLQVALSRHPELFPVRDVYETFMFLKPRAALEMPMPHMTLAYLQGEENAAALRNLCEELRASGASLSEADTIRAFFFFCAQRVYPGRRPLEKTPAHVRKLNSMLQIFPRARVIVCTRDPVSIVASYRKRLAAEKALGRPWAEWSWLDRSTEQLIAHFEAVTEQIELARIRWPQQVFIAPYEWMVADAPVALRQICDFARLPFVPELLSPAEVYGRKVDTLLSSPITRRPSDDDQYVDAREADDIRRLTAELLPLWSTPGVAERPQ